MFVNCVHVLQNGDDAIGNRAERTGMLQITPSEYLREKKKRKGTEKKKKKKKDFIRFNKMLTSCLPF
jgi:hypothetical protein